MQVEDVIQDLDNGVPSDVLVLFDDTEVEREAAAFRDRRRLRYDDPESLSRKSRHLARIKSATMQGMDDRSYAVLRSYSHLPMALIRFKDRKTLEQLRARPGFRAIYPNRRQYPALDPVSAGLIGQPSAQLAGAAGAGATVLVVDSGVDYTQPDFGPCSAPGVPAACKVIYSSNISGSGGALDTASTQHGTNIAGIVVGVAPEARIAAVNVFGTIGSTTDALVLQAINWGIANRATFNIRAINLSLGDGSFNTAPCGNPSLNPYVNAIANARSAGIITVVAAGNEGYTSAIANPACTPQAMSVGAVYSQNWGSVSGSCSDATTAADQVACFSNSASFLTAWAPGAFITAGGRQLAGTSQATPFISGAVAVLRAAYPAETLDQTVARITTRGVPVTDARNGVTKPRLDVFDSVRPANDDFLGRFVGSGMTGSASGSTAFASKESSEPNHAGNPGGRSVWWRWTAPATGQVALDTHGSAIDTLLAVYTGTSVGALTPVASSDNDGSVNGGSGLYFQALAGVEYAYAVDGKNAAAGSVALTWHLNTAATANLRVSTSITPATVAAGDTVAFGITLVNDGPQPATNARATGTLPSQFVYQSGDANCSVVGANFTCLFGTVAAGVTGTLFIQLRAVTPGATQVGVVVSSDVSDPVTANNASATPISVTPSARSVPMPPWSWVVAAMVLAVLGRWRLPRR